MRTDFQFRNEGSICLLTPLSAPAQRWVAAHIPDDAQHWGGAVVIEPRHVGDILNGITRDGLSINT